MKTYIHLVHNKLALLFLLAGMLLLVHSFSYSISTQTYSNAQQSSVVQNKSCLVPKDNSQFIVIAGIYCSHDPCSDCTCVSECTHNHSGKLSFITLIPASLYLTIHSKIHTSPLMLATGMMGQPFRPPIYFS
ncbi:hypothetical protein MNBD_GAMMA12-999 [hydrothermal vent metagenome]|uniref:Uncharacterized protein n=1 Tax=hydrothermal vent metagenome TaxID=652676 RepID=A0A3B0YNI4_9ZZZZ